MSCAHEAVQVPILFSAYSIRHAGKLKAFFLFTERVKHLRIVSRKRISRRQICRGSNFSQRRNSKAVICCQGNSLRNTQQVSEWASFPSFQKKRNIQTFPLSFRLKWISILKDIFFLLSISFLRKASINILGSIGAQHTAAAVCVCVCVRWQGSTWIFIWCSKERKALCVVPACIQWTFFRIFQVATTWRRKWKTFFLCRESTSDIFSSSKWISHSTISSFVGWWKEGEEVLACTYDIRGLLLLATCVLIGN